MKKYAAENTGFPEIASIVSAACLAHDIGNPPFGHSGERAISAYFMEGNGRMLENKVNKEGGRWEDFVHFEGNANTMRLLTHQFVGRRRGGFALTYCTLASIVKYPYPSTLSHNGKFGFFQTEESTYRQIASELGIEDSEGRYARYPLVYLVEAADDICYQIMDIEDAHKLRILTEEETKELLLGFFEGRQRNHILDVMRLVNDANEQIAYLRSSIVGSLVDECSRVFLEQEDNILEGRFNSSLIKEIKEPVRSAYEACSSVAYRKIYCAREVLDIELAGYHIFSQLIDILTEAVMNPGHSYSLLLLQHIPEQYDIHALSIYGKIQCILDYISGMTDVYALDLYRKVTGLSLPAV
jgi:dGTPase